MMNIIIYLFVTNFLHNHHSIHPSPKNDAMLRVLLLSSSSQEGQKSLYDENDESYIWENIRNPKFDIQTLPPSLSHLLSTSQRFANAYNMTEQDIIKYKEQYQKSINDMKRKYNYDNIKEGKVKHNVQCMIRYTFGRDPFVCQQCWTYKPICVCDRVQVQQITKCDYVDKVIIWTHMDEWGRTSNTGSIVGLALGDSWCHVLMKGLEIHDNMMNDIIINDGNEMIMPIVLWPKIDFDDNLEQEEEWISIKEIQDIIQKNENSNDGDDKKHQMKFVIIAIEGTWRNARRMVKKLPSHVKRLDLRDALSDVVESSSILKPLRSQGDGASQSNVCTAEAVVAALHLFGLSSHGRDHILGMTRTKIDLVKRFQGKAKI